MDQPTEQTAVLDSWDQDEDQLPNPASSTSEVSGLNTEPESLPNISELNVNAPTFVPNVHAPAFVPSFAVEPSGTPVNDTDIGLSETKDEPEKDAEEEVPAPAAIQVAKKKIAKVEIEDVKKENVNVVFIGHVDAGKSTIGGHIMFLTGQVDKRTLEKYEREAREKNRESWYLSWALDTNQEERDKGKTVEVGRAYFETDRKHFTMLDAPGHRSFVPNMIGGAAQADLAVLVISARKGEFETGFERGGQTREHAMLVKTAGVKHLVVLINKMDDPTVQWSEERFKECQSKLVPFLKKVGFSPKKDVYFIPVSGMTGANLKDLSSQCPWYSGPSFIEYIDELSISRLPVDGPFIMPVVDKYKDMGTILLGKIESGEISKGSSLVLMPNKTPVEVLTILVDDDERNSATAGDNVKVKVRGVEEDDVSSGFVLCDTINPCHTGREFIAQIVIIEYKSIICAGYNAVLHIHSAVEEAQLSSLIALVDKKTGNKTKGPRFIKQDQVAIACLTTAGIICLETFKDFPQMGRFTLRDEGKTIAIGKVLKLIN
ncbi:eukaryotic peptide chain release factor GTP-binding subunit ERF3A-like [Anneissia japonica]|uniref:eukaryotic peptide chain release factor GTP-binding subunit ERF3A-like n=1 Tax=Anneissia japonica TaxID=1529436 RepID=UPI001425808C|nr:eukaryotic peptide chain release factor GTP-binding subunit ERF3A-like [Anneissia japonica]